MREELIGRVFNVASGRSVEQVNAHVRAFDFGDSLLVVRPRFERRRDGLCQANAFLLQLCDQAAANRPAQILRSVREEDCELLIVARRRFFYPPALRLDDLFEVAQSATEVAQQNIEFRFELVALQLGGQRDCIAGSLLEEIVLSRPMKRRGPFAVRPSTIFGSPPWMDTVL